MNYTVLMTPDAEQELADIWLQATDRDAVTRASNTIDRLLAIDPLNEGESRSRGRRILFVPPLGVIFAVREDDRCVDILNVWGY